ncbi:MAG TPA: type IV secretion system protein [Longimicrobium sp.]|nr:type IV secretion system protein [Longimicrobium sp.]
MTVDTYSARRRAVDGKIRRLERGSRFLGFLLALSLAKDPILAWGIAEAAARPGAVPWYVPVDRLGQVGTPVRGSDASVPGAELIQPKIRKCIADLRVVYADPIALGDRQREGRACLRGEALAYVDRYFASEAANPFVLAGDRIRRVDVTRVLQIRDGAKGSNSWKVEWRETELPRDANSTGAVTAWGAIVTVSLIPGRTGEEIEANASGVFITGLDWRADSAPTPLPRNTTNAESEP